MTVNDHAALAISSTEITRIVAEHVARIVDADLRDEVARVLIEPMLREVPWNYGEDGETLACWIIADLRPAKPDVLAYCDRGFGPGYPFGILDADLPSMGTDGQWFLTLEDGLRVAFGGRYALAEVD